VLHGVPVYLPAYAGTKLYVIVVLSLINSQHELLMDDSEISILDSIF